MSTGVYLALSILGAIVAGIAATGTKLLREFSPHELEDISRLRRRMDRFDAILERHESTALGTECLQVVGAATLIVSSGFYLAQVTGQTDTASVYPFVTILLLAGFALLLVTSWIPWTLVRIWSTPLLYHTWPIWWVIGRLLWPLSVGVNVADGVMRRLAGCPEEETDEEEAFEDEIRTIVTTGHREGLLESDAREMIEGVIELGDTDVSDIMTPRSHVDAFEIGFSWEEVLQFVVRVRRTRIPVYEETIDNIIGVLFVKDLLAELSQPSSPSTPPSVRQMLRQPWFVPATKAVDAMLREFLSTRSHLAIVVDEYHSVAGVVTIEDVLEEIVGEIVDEADQEVEDEITRINGRTAEVLGSTHLHELNERLAMDLPECDAYDTVAGLMLDSLGQIPKVGEYVIQGRVRLEVVEASKRRIERIRVETLGEADENLPLSRENP